MKKLLPILSLVVLAGVAFAQATHKSAAPAAQFPTSGPHMLKATYVSSGSLNVKVLPAGDMPVDAVQTITCPGTTGTCLIQADAWVQVGESGTAGNEVALSLFVDGKEVNATGFYGSEIPLDYNWIQTSTSISVAGIPVGVHHVQMHMYTDFGASANYYNINYKVFKP